MRDDEPEGRGHVPVMAREAVDWMLVDPDGTYVDATLGEGGHAELVCRRLHETGHLIGIDRDPTAHRLAEARLSEWAPQVTQVQGRFADLREILADLSVEGISGVLFDLGVSSMQIDEPERGFSYRFDGPLDMRMGGGEGPPAWELIARMTERELADTIYRYGEEPQSRAIARDIAAAGNITTTGQLAEIVRRRSRGKPEKALSRVFQALRIAVNNELTQLEDGLGGALERLIPRGRIVVISYHSLEDRIVKQWMRRESRDCICPPEVPECRCGHRAQLKVLTRKVVKPSDEECARNSRARSARLRAAERVSHAA